MRSPVRRVSFACAALLLGTSLAACGAETTAPGVVLSFQTDLAAPKDITHVGLYVRVISGANPGKLLKNIVFNVERDRVQLPSTYTLVSAGKPVTVRVQVVGFRTRVVDPNKGAPEPFILREAVIAVPTERLAKLDLPLSWADQGSVSKQARDEWAADPSDAFDYEAGFSSTCSPDGGKVYRLGACVASDSDESKLPNYVPERDDPNRVGTCFDVAACFRNATKVTVRGDCSIDFTKFDPDRINLAFATADGAGIPSTPSGAAAPLVPMNLDRSRTEGFSIEKGRVQLSQTACNAHRSGAATAIWATAACASKTFEHAPCGPSNPATARETPRNDTLTQ